MKKKYVVGSALLLLLSVATGFYIDEHPRANGQNGAAAQPAITTGDAVATNTGDAGAPNSDNSQQSGLNAGQDPAASEARAGGHNNQWNRNNIAAAEQTGDSYETPAMVTDDNNAVVLNNPKKVTVAAPKIYYTKATDNDMDKSSKKHHHFHFRLPENTGIEIGYNQSGLTNNQTNNIPVGNVNLGVLYNLSLGNHLAFQPGIMYISKGNRLQNETEIDNKEKLTMHYLEMPANLVWKIGRIGNARLMVGAGPYASYMVSAKDKYQATPFTDDGDYQPSTQQYTTSKINRFDWGMGGFIGCQSPDGFFLKAGAEYGMMDLMKNTNGGTSGRDYSIMINIGFIMGNKL